MGDITSDFTYNGALEPPAIPGVRTRRKKGVKNYALSEKVRERVRKEILPHLKEIRDRRAQLNSDWSTYERIWELVHTEQAYEGRANLFIPAAKKGVETLVPQLIAATFPGDDAFGVDAPDDSLRDEALKCQNLLRHRIDVTAKVRSEAETFYRQLAIKGNSPAKVYHRRKVVKGKGRKVQDGVGRPGDQEYILYDGPVFETLDAQNVYVWPETARDVNQCEIVFEDMTVTRAHLNRMARKGKYIRSEVDLVASGPRNKEKQTADVENLQSQGINSPHASSRGSTNGRLCDITEVWVEFDPDAESWEEEENPIPVLMTVTDTAVLRVIDNPFWHKRCPILIGRMGRKVGRFWGVGVVETVRDLQSMLNDQANQVMDGAAWSLNPMTMYNPDLVFGDMPDLAPGISIPVSDVSQAIKTTHPPMDIINGGSVLLTQTMSWINDFTGAPPVMQGGAAPGRAWRSATGIGTAREMATMPLQEIVRGVEKEVWEPMLEMFYIIDQQFTQKDLLVLLKPGEYMAVDPRLIPGGFSFRWLASSQTANRQMKGTMIERILQNLTNPGLVQLMMAQGAQINPIPLIRKLYQEVLGYRDVDQIIVQAPVQNPVAQAPPGPPEPAAEPEIIPSAYENEDPMLQNVSDFMGMRAGADDLAGSMGSLMGLGGV